MLKETCVCYPSSNFPHDQGTKLTSCNMTPHAFHDSVVHAVGRDKKDLPWFTSHLRRPHTASMDLSFSITVSRATM